MPIGNYTVFLRFIKRLCFVVGNKNIKPLSEMNKTTVKLNIRGAMQSPPCKNKLIR